MRKKSRLVYALMIFLSTFMVTTFAYAAERFEWTISANGGNPAPLVYTVRGEKFSGKIFQNEIEGYQVGRHIIFYRKSGARQIYHGWMSPNRKSISGYFSHQGDNLGIWQGERN